MVIKHTKVTWKCPNCKEEYTFQKGIDPYFDKTIKARCVNCGSYMIKNDPDQNIEDTLMLNKFKDKTK